MFPCCHSCKKAAAVMQQCGWWLLRGKTPVFSRQTRTSLANGLVWIINSVCHTATDSLIFSHHAVLHLPLAPTHILNSTRLLFFSFQGFFVSYGLFICSCSQFRLNSNPLHFSSLKLQAGLLRSFFGALAILVNPVRCMCCAYFREMLLKWCSVI